jgi:acetyl/propionyl-CoA carboxylase alpha subunit
MDLTTLLIANRGEIAVRVIRTARSLGLRTVAIHTDLDAKAPHVQAADESVRVSGYLDIDAVVAAASAAGADAVHPGYGFLSERAAFAAALRTAGITLVGPSVEVMERMGRKDEARHVAVAAGVPVVPSFPLGSDPATLPYPVLVKAAAGGGGKGMRVVRGADEFAEAVSAARREAASSFGDDTLLIEKYVQSGRHIEVQVIGDTHGTVLHLWERDCSTQRRHQKVLEEAPAPTISREIRSALCEAAADLARAVEYVGAGTVEFLLDSATGEFYFLEMNTRLQVEHPVTQAITGLDLVELQLRVAAGEPLPVTQEQVRSDGHAIEARVYAEDAYGGFLPQAGRATLVCWPERVPMDGTTVRVDQALVSGQTVGTAYDPMLGKVIVHGPDREAARRGLVAALDETVIHGLTTNTGFLRRLVAGEPFRDAVIDTAWLDTPAVSQTWLTAPGAGPARTLAAWALHLSQRQGDGPFRSDGFRLGAAVAPVVVQLDVPVTLDGTVSELPPHVSITAEYVELTVNGQRHRFARPGPSRTQHATSVDGSVTAPMPGTVLEVRVHVGQRVAKGDVLGLLEAMKMELALGAPFDGTVSAIGAQAWSQVRMGDLLFEIEEADQGQQA